MQPNQVPKDTGRVRLISDAGEAWSSDYVRVQEFMNCDLEIAVYSLMPVSLVIEVDAYPSSIILYDDAYNPEKKDNLWVLAFISAAKSTATSLHKPSSLGAFRTILLTDYEHWFVINNFSQCKHMVTYGLDQLIEAIRKVIP